MTVDLCALGIVVLTYLPTKYRGDQSSRCRDMASSIFFKMSAVRHHKFFNLGNLTFERVKRVNLRHHTKFLGDRSNHYRDIAIFRFSIWQPSGILDLMCACLDYPLMAFSSL